MSGPAAIWNEREGKTEVRFRPQGPQIDLVSCPVFDVFYGGARGGGKTYGLIFDFIAHANRFGAAGRGVLFRRTYDELEEIERICHEVLGGVWQWQAARRTWCSPNGATLKLRYLDRDEDADRYQGHQYSRIYVDDAGLWPNPRPIDRLLGSLRSPEGAHVGRRITGNPGGPGHQWLRRRYVDPAPPWTPFRYRPQPDIQPDWTLEAVFIPATLDDNPMLTQRDPDYERRLAAAGGPELFRAWRHGDWSVVAGAALEINPERHLVKAFAVPDHWTLFGGFDWGYAHWWVFAWYAVNEDGTVFCLDTIRGRRMRDPEIVAAIKRQVPRWRELRYVVAGLDCWARPRMDQDSPTTAERFEEEGIHLTKANVDRIMGLRNLREYLAWRGVGPNGEDGDPRFAWFDTPGNRRAMAAIQAIVLNPDNPEDALKVDADQETGAGGDDDYDQLRYALASRPAVAKSTWRDQSASAWDPAILEAEADRQRRVKPQRRRSPGGVSGTDPYI